VIKEWLWLRYTLDQHFANLLPALAQWWRLSDDWVATLSPLFSRILCVLTLEMKGEASESLQMAELLGFSACNLACYDGDKSITYPLG
jgi:hypothetical protein